MHVGIKRLSIPIILIRVHKRVVFGHSVMNTNKSHFFKMKRNSTKGLNSLSLATRNTTRAGLHYYMLHYLKPTKNCNITYIYQTHRLQQQVSLYRSLLKPDYDNYIKQKIFLKNQDTYIVIKLPPLWQRYAHICKKKTRLVYNLSNRNPNHIYISFIFKSNFNIRHQCVCHIL